MWGATWIVGILKLRVVGTEWQLEAVSDRIT